MHGANEAWAEWECVAPATAGRRGFANGCPAAEARRLLLSFLYAYVKLGHEE
jgi:hypothetical protein